MKGYLLDTHVLLWAAGNPKQLSNKCRFILERRKEDRFFSMASVWEIAIKSGLGKLTLPTSCEEFITTCQSDLGFSVLSLELRHVCATERIELHHRDPFDRIIIAQALNEGLAILSQDSSFDSYGIQRIW